MSDLTVCVSQLGHLGRSLDAIAGALTNRDGALRFDADEVGGQEVRDALKEFDDNWDDRRDLLVRSVESVATMATQAAAVFREADEKLAKSARAILEGG